MNKNEHGTLMSNDTLTPVGHVSVEGDHVHSSVAVHGHYSRPVPNIDQLVTAVF